MPADIPATEPTVLDGVFDRWAFSIQTSGFGAAEYGSDVIPPVSCVATLARYRVRPDGVPELSPLATDRRTIVIRDLYAIAATNSKVADALASQVAAVAAIAEAEGVL
jgi:hypothetical protein